MAHLTARAGRARRRRVRRAVGRHGATAAGLLALAALLGACAAPQRAPAPGATAGEALAQGSSVRTVTVGSAERTYRAYRPARLTEPAPLVLVFHGYGGDAAEIERATGWTAQAERLGALVLFPQGVARSFDAGGCCGDAARGGVDDVAAALAMIEDVSEAVPVDPGRLYSTGFSNGGMMSYRLACETDRFAAIGPVAGSALVDCRSPSPTSLLHIHGLADRTVPAAGETRADGLVVPAADEVVARWRERLGCAPATEDGGDGLRRSSATCPDGRAVDLITIDGLGHTWPTASDGLDATREVADFFARHHR